MSEVSDRYRRVADGFGTRLSRIRSDQWASATPCAEWDVRELVAHVVATHGRVIATVDPTALPEVDPASDLQAQFSAATAAVSRTLEDPERSTRIVSGMFGEQPFESLVSRLLCTDTLFHTWDLARATGQDDGLDPDAVAVARDFLEPLDQAIRRPGGFAARIDPPADADDQTRLLNFGGRPTA